VAYSRSVPPAFTLNTCKAPPIPNLAQLDPSLLIRSPNVVSPPIFDNAIAAVKLISALTKDKATIEADISVSLFPASSATVKSIFVVSSQLNACLFVEISDPSNLAIE